MFAHTFWTRLAYKKWEDFYIKKQTSPFCFGKNWRIA